MQKTISQPEFILEKNSLIKEGLILKKLGRKVEILQIEKIKVKGFKAFVRFDKLSIDGDTANIYFEYPIQGLGVEAVFVFSSPATCQWKIFKNKLFEYKVYSLADEPEQVDTIGKSMGARNRHFGTNMTVNSVYTDVDVYNRNEIGAWVKTTTEKRTFVNIQ